ncbi:uncharacterized protein GIQ15_04464 [Arthroderma uncinatum]|uniref:uncharacterized protein n=1 Tax=Arthroderma uncinatum TaxID=74035 RepID=UPI00144AB262|nr:uncharacterized protein GIQ15_04464 [Arthroderma uncinatum]KAF3481705.1 hypothetical protein GIQ15_04464 [Arthroderma uncinatum]
MSLSTNAITTLVEYADITVSEPGIIWYWAVTGIFSLSAVVFLVGSFVVRHPNVRLLYYLSALSCYIFSMTYFAMGANIGWVAVEVEFARGSQVVFDTATQNPTRQVFWIRYAGWLLATPILMTELFLFINAPLSLILHDIFMVGIVMITGLGGALIPTAYKWAYYVYGAFACVALAWMIMKTGYLHATTKKMPVSSLHLLSFALRNPYSFSLDPDGPFPALYRLFAARIPTIDSIDPTQFVGKTILITGANGGCGFECAKMLAHFDCRIILTARNLERGQEALREVQNEATRSGIIPKVELSELDLTSFESIRSFNKELRKLSKVDMAILNAGIYDAEFSLCSETGRESHIQPSVNELLNQINDPTAYACYERYHISKLLVVLWIQELAKKVDSSKVLVGSISPGLCRTGLFRSFNSNKIAQLLEKIVYRNVSQAACQYLYVLATMNQVSHGSFFADGKPRPYKPTRKYLE